MEKRVSMKENMKQLKGFIIRAFIFAVCFLGIVEKLINLLFIKCIFPLFSELFSQYQIKLNYSDPEMFFGIVVYLFLILLFNIIQMLPKVISVPLSIALRNFAETAFQMDINIGGFSGNISFGERFFVRCVAIGAVALLLMLAVSPYVFATLLFTKTVSKRVQQQETALEKERNLMLADVAHDLKTPLTTISGYSQMLLESHNESEEEYRYLKNIHDKSLRMDEMLTLFFEYLKLESEGFSLNKEKADLCEILRENTALYYMDFEDKGLLLEVDIPEKPVEDYIDKRQMSRAITNLITNTLKHNNKGTKVRIYLHTKDGIVMGIADNGREIPKEVAEHIFEPFSMGDESRNSKNGSGLGLSIASKIISMHGGKLKLEKGMEGYTKEFRIYL